LGICLGAQLIADVLGARVTPNKHKEIGWFPVSLHEQASILRPFKHFTPDFTAFHWHGDTFSLPEGAVALGSSQACHTQGFMFGRRVMGLQFHLESTMDSVNALLDTCGSEIVAGAPYIHPADKIRADTMRLRQVSNDLMRHLLDDWIVDKG
jgi:GMP synthase-like glutamine amidotransferase